jgi:hypothetical protein
MAFRMVSQRSGDPTYMYIYTMTGKIPPADGPAYKVDIYMYVLRDVCVNITYPFIVLKYTSIYYVTSNNLY